MTACQRNIQIMLSFMFCIQIGIAFSPNRYHVKHFQTRRNSDTSSPTTSTTTTTTTTSSTRTHPFSTTYTKKYKQRDCSLNMFPFFKGNKDENNDHNNDEEEEGMNHHRHRNHHHHHFQQKKERKNKIDNRNSEFNIEDDVQTYQQRKLQHEQQELQNTFAAYGDELWQLRSTLVHLSKQLIQMIAASSSTSSNNSEDDANTNNSIGSIVSEDELREMIREVEMKDPEYVYALEKERLEKAIEENRMEDALIHREKANAARSVLPQFNLHGLWVGDYGANKGFEMLNVTYMGDTLIARKVTGDDNVPAGEITFQADLSPPKPTQTTFQHSDKEKKPLPNIVLSEEASKKWNTKQLSRFTGLGNVAEKGFVNSQWLDGQLVYINKEYFSFAWLPLNHQILFGRPTYEMTVDMLTKAKKVKEEGKGMILDEDDIYDHTDDDDNDELCTIPPSVDDDIDILNEHIMKCFGATLQLVEECSLQDDSSCCIFYDDDLNLCFE